MRKRDVNLFLFLFLIIILAFSVSANVGVCKIVPLNCGVEQKSTFGWNKDKCLEECAGDGGTCCRRDITLRWRCMNQECYVDCSKEKSGTVCGTSNIDAIKKLKICNGDKCILKNSLLKGKSCGHNDACLSKNCVGWECVARDCTLKMKTTWTPKANTKCVKDGLFTQTNDCGDTRRVPGIKVCIVTGDPEDSEDIVEGYPEDFEDDGIKDSDKKVKSC